MPLAIGDASTERPHVIAFDPASPAETKDAEASEKNLLERGFTVEKRAYGEIVMKPPKRNPFQGIFRVLSPSGDDRIVWDRRKKNEVKEAYQTFKDFLKKGYTAYASLLNGKKGHKIEDFDPGLEEIILVPSTMPG